MTQVEKILPASFYRSDSGVEPVRDWIKNELSNAERRTIGEDIATLEFSWPVGQPKCKKIAGQSGLWEIRSTLSNRKIARVFFCVFEGRLILLHGFIKKSQKAPKRDIDLAVKRMNEVKQKI